MLLSFFFIQRKIIIFVLIHKEIRISINNVAINLHFSWIQNANLLCSDTIIIFIRKLFLLLLILRSQIQLHCEFGFFVPIYNLKFLQLHNNLFLLIQYVILRFWLCVYIQSKLFFFLLTWLIQLIFWVIILLFLWLTML